MTERIFDDYSAREFFDWLEDEYADEYISEEIEEHDGDTVIVSKFDIERLKKSFLYYIRRYTIVKRGYKFYIHDERHCADIMMFRYTDENEEEIQNHVNNICKDLNQGKVFFTGKKHKCDWI